LWTSPSFDPTKQIDTNNVADISDEDNVLDVAPAVQPASAIKIKMEGQGIKTLRAELDAINTSVVAHVGYRPPSSDISGSTDDVGTNTAVADGDQELSTDPSASLFLQAPTLVINVAIKLLYSSTCSKSLNLSPLVINASPVISLLEVPACQSFDSTALGLLLDLLEVLSNYPL
jgi:hypothetical protein